MKASENNVSVDCMQHCREFYFCDRWLFTQRYYMCTLSVQVCFSNTFHKVKIVERSKALVSSTGPKGRGFKSHSWHKYFSRTTLHFHINYSGHSNYVMKGSNSSFEINVYGTFITLITIPREVLRCFYRVMRN